jgi:chromosome segregation ATPase
LKFLQQKLSYSQSQLSVVTQINQQLVNQLARIQQQLYEAQQQIFKYQQQYSQFQQQLYDLHD